MGEAWSIVVALLVIAAASIIFFIQSRKKPSTSPKEAVSKPAPQASIKSSKDEKDLGNTAWNTSGLKVEGAAEEVEEGEGFNMDDLDDLLDEAADEFDLDACLEEAADSIADQEQSKVSEKTKAAKELPPVPKVWQESLDCLPVAQRVEWASVIQEDISRQQGINYRYRAFSRAYAPIRLKRPTPHTAEEVLYSMLQNVLPADKIKEFTRDEELMDALKLQMKRDVSSRLEGVPLDKENVKAEPKRFPRCMYLLSC